MADETVYKPTVLEKRSEAERFTAMNDWVTHRNGRIVSSPGAALMRVEALEGSSLPAELEAAGYEPEYVEDRERLLTAGIVEKFHQNAKGELVAATEGSTKPVIERTHAGIARVRVFEFKF